MTLPDGITSPWPKEFLDAGVAPLHCNDVLRGSYDVPYENPHPIILDIGANIGAFVRWSRTRWPFARVYCFEPHPETFKKLCTTIKSLGEDVLISAINAAVLNQSGELVLRDMPTGNEGWSGENSLFRRNGDAEDGIPVPVFDATVLPLADIVKIDTEGAEIFILERMIQTGRLERAKAIMLEYHRAGEEFTIPKLLEPLGFKLHHHRPDHWPARGELKFLRT